MAACTLPGMDCPASRAAAIVGLALASALAVAGCGPGPLNSPSTGTGCSLTVTLPVRGGHPMLAVVARVGVRAARLDQPSNTLSIPCGLVARLDAASAPPGGPTLTGWSLAGRLRRRPAITVVIDGLITATAEVRLPSPGSPPTSLPLVTPPPGPTPG
ncbi:MAG TPA: hypothetical protein VMW47_03415 [Verrucomicrobiae bacterium]|nr:hypothetical protein [Verrucomicrobiae bacterium]